ncbi:MAG TPA: glycosyltransferase family A protein [Acidobacteriaceae bacterium]|nr:glycosyltransferase family A protein [Acidobacteriaceae bacterium]
MNVSGAEVAAGMRLSVIIPARNEQDCVGECLRSLVAQEEDGWRLGREWEILLVDDHSTDDTRAIAEGVAGVTVMEAPKLETGWTGKANAVWAGAQAARGEWLLFTDADTVHEAGSASRAIVEAEQHEVAMLSYSPRQIVTGLWQRALMPLVFSELAVTYPPAKVSDPESRLAAANGQFLLVRRDVYFAIGGHEAVKDAVLEDVTLAQMVKRRKQGLRLRYAPEAVAVRMYRSVGAMAEGWTKNLALLFGNALAMAAWRVLDLVLLVGLPLLTLWTVKHNVRGVFSLALLLMWARTLWRFYGRVRKSNFPFVDCLVSPVALPLFAALLYRSWFKHTVLKRVSWKGREYVGGR